MNGPNSTRRLSGGVHAAIPTPRNPEGHVDWESFGCLLSFHSPADVDGLVVNGATGEYPNNTLAEAAEIFVFCGRALQSRIPFACGIGSATAQGSVELGRAALNAGAHSLLLPAPFFFPYSQDDLAAHCAEIARQLPGPILLYNLPQFATGFQLDTVRRLADLPGITGLKDSSGSLEIFRDLRGSPQDAFSRLIGNDAVLVQALDEGVCHGVVSGVAGVLPELISYLYRQHEQRRSSSYLAAETHLNELLERLSTFPIPWALKWAAESRGFGPAHFSQTVSVARRRQSREFQEWFQGWWPSVQALLPTQEAAPLPA